VAEAWTLPEVPAGGSQPAEPSGGQKGVPAYSSKPHRPKKLRFSEDQLPNFTLSEVGLFTTEAPEEHPWWRGIASEELKQDEPIKDPEHLKGLHMLLNATKCMLRGPGLTREEWLKQKMDGNNPVVHTALQWGHEAQKKVRCLKQSPDKPTGPPDFVSGGGVPGGRRSLSQWKPTGRSWRGESRSSFTVTIASP